MSTDNTRKRTALLVRCTEEEAETIRDSARAERRTISGFVLNVVFRHLESPPNGQRTVDELLVNLRDAPFQLCTNKCAKLSLDGLTRVRMAMAPF
jgi:uncharacterized protein (DUF1778 family)